MQIRYPKAYKSFRCIASDCPDSCCKEWEVLVDPQTAAVYRSMQGPLGEDLRFPAGCIQRSALRKSAD